MNTQTENSASFNSLNLLYFIYKWRKALIIITILAVVISSIVALTIPEKYKSTVILFPSTTSSISKALLTETSFKNEDVLQFGAEDEAEQMLQILNSDEIRTRICEKYNLMKHYKIDSTDKFKRTKLYDEFQSNITFKRTEYMSVKIEVMDRNPDTAAIIANDIANLHDSIKIKIQRQIAKEAFKIVENEYLSKQKEVEILGDSLIKLNKIGIYDVEKQTERLTEQYAIAIRNNDARATKALEEKLKVIADYGTPFAAIRDNVYLQRKQLNLLKLKYDESKVDATEILPQKFVVSNAFPAEKKSYPIRWIIVVVSTIASLLMSIIGILLIENIREIKTK